MAMGRPEEALAEGRVAMELDPASVSIRRSMGWLHYYARRPERALEHLRRAVEMNPTAEENHRLLGLAYLSDGAARPGRGAFREAIATSDSPALSTAGLGRVAARRGETTRRERCSAADRMDPGSLRQPAAFAMVHIELGEID